MKRYFLNSVLSCIVLILFLYNIGHSDSNLIIDSRYSKKTSLEAFPSDYTKKRIIITTDIGGGDKDDTQSMIHFLVYANMFDLEGIIISRPRGHVSEMQRVINAYRKDYSKFTFISPDYPTPRQLKSLIKIGAERNKKTPSPGYSSSTPGSKLIVKQARKIDDRPLYIMAWGSTTDIAQAIHDAPDIVDNIRVFAGGTIGYNYELDPTPTDYLRTIKKLIWIDTDSTGRGIYLWGMGDKSKYGNVGFVSKVIKPRGSLGRLFYNISAPINVNKYGIKMGDTTQLLFLFNGSFETPFKPSWGGQYCKKERTRYIDCKNDELKIGSFYGARTVGKHRVDILKDWEKRLIAIYDH